MICLHKIKPLRTVEGQPPIHAPAEIGRLSWFPPLVCAKVIARKLGSPKRLTLLWVYITSIWQSILASTREIGPIDEGVKKYGDRCTKRDRNQPKDKTAPRPHLLRAYLIPVARWCWAGLHNWIRIRIRPRPPALEHPPIEVYNRRLVSHHNELSSFAVPRAGTRCRSR